MFFTLCVFAATWRFLAERRAPGRSHAGSALLFALATLTRPEGALFAALAGAFLLLEATRGRVGLRALWLFAVGYAVPVGAHLLWRHAYYGSWLPNTFYAKVPGTWVAQGLGYLALYEKHYHALLFVPFALLALLG